MLLQKSSPGTIIVDPGHSLKSQTTSTPPFAIVVALCNGYSFRKKKIDIYIKKPHRAGASHYCISANFIEKTKKENSNQYLYLPLKPTTNHQTNNMNELMFLILLTLSTCTSANTFHPSSKGINPHPHAHHASSETLFQLVDMVRTSKLIHGLAPWSLTFTPLDSTHIDLLPGQTLDSMPMHSKAEKKGK
jgi:hypothetical protein